MIRAALGLALMLAGCSDERPRVTPGGGGGAAGHGGSAAGMGGEPGGGGGSVALPAVFEVQGVVVDEDGTPVADAVVQQGGRPASRVASAADGGFAVEVRAPWGLRPVVSAAKQGYRTRGIDLFEAPTAPVTIALLSAHLPDNEAYVYLDPGDGIDVSKEDCTHCHTTFVQQFLGSKHAEAARDPLVQDVYAGVNRALDQAGCAAAGGSWKQGHAPGTATALDRCYIGGGVLPDLNDGCGDAAQPACDDPAIDPSLAPTAFGACADCHAPAMDGALGGRDLHEAVGLAYDIGVHCDFCHKIRDVDLSLPAGVGGRLVIQRPAERADDMFVWEPLFFGPLYDVPNVVMGASPQPKYEQAVFCAGCHEHHQPALIAGQSLNAARWPDGLPVHSTYSEWLDGPYADSDTACQFCHMPASFALNNSLDLSTPDNQGIVYGFTRPPEDTRQHVFRGPLAGMPRLVDGALFVSIALSQLGTSLTASVSLANIGCGHALPTGEPMRALVLVIEADASCGPLQAIGGMTINDIGGASRSGVAGIDASSAATTITWAAGAAAAQPGHVVRVVRPTGSFDDYTGIGFFADPMLTPPEKGMPIQAPVAEATVLSVSADQIVVDQAMPIQAGDILYLGDGWPSAPTDGQTALDLAGMAGYSFARVLVDAAGQRQVPHHRAVDIASDNRIPPGDNAITEHVFEVPGGCTNPSVEARVLYRPVPTQQAKLRSWPANDYLIAYAQASL